MSNRPTRQQGGTRRTTANQSTAIVTAGSTRTLDCEHCGAPAIRPNRQARRQGAGTYVWFHQHWCRWAPLGQTDRTRQSSGRPGWRP
jgi:hypothetical protein